MKHYSFITIYKFSVTVQGNKLVCVTQKKSEDGVNWETIKYIIEGNKIDKIKLDRVGYEDGLRERVTTITRPDRTTLSTFKEYDTGYKFSSYDETGNNILTYVDKNGPYVQRTVFTYTGTGDDKVLAGKTSETYNNNCLIKISNITIDRVNGTEIYNEVLTTYDEVTKKKDKKVERRYSLKNGLTLFDSWNNLAMKDLYSKEYKYYDPSNELNLDEIKYIYYQLIMETEWKYEYANKPDQISLAVTKEYTYGDSNNNTYRVITGKYTEDGYGTESFSEAYSFTPIENTHWFREAVAPSQSVSSDTPQTSSESQG